ncbi:MAG: hypothetical protein MZW92_14495 [Comamonadaceae bacterium]|nr:hypothetical protein [Comamonadaceae bacterium]
MRAAFLNSHARRATRRARVERAAAAPASSTCSTSRPSAADAAFLAHARARWPSATARAVRDRRGALRRRSGATTSARSTCSCRVLHERFPGVPRIALTATADAHTRAEIVERLALDDARVLRRQLRPPEHPLHASSRSDDAARAAAALHPRRAPGRRRHRLLPGAQARSRRPPPGCATQGIAALPYHAGLRRRDARAAHQDALPARGRRR